MNILVIGNGFDLAHGFPTTYKNFLEFTDVFKRYIPICKKEEIEPEEIHIKDKEKVMFLHDLNKREQNIFEELENLLIDNIWINYFWEIYEARISIGKDGWIDFENEISKVVQTIDKVNREIQKSKREESEIKDISFYEKQLFESIELDINKVIGDGIEEYKTHLLRDLNRLIRGLEIYLAYYVERITPDTRIQDIEALDIQCVLSFNYTNTYEKWYCTDKEKKENMEVQIEFTFNGSTLGGKQLVTFEELYDMTNPEEPKKVTEHKDIDDEGQTVTIKEVPETPTPEIPGTTTKTSNPPKTGDTTNAALWIAILVLSAAGITGVRIWNKKKQIKKLGIEEKKEEEE